MKNTMRYLSMAALALVGALTAGCSSDDNIVEQPQQPDNKSNVVTLTTTVSMDGGAATRALSSGGVKTFAAGETMAIIYKNSSNETVKAVSSALTAGDITAGKSATFTFTLTDPDKAQNVAYIYPAAMAVETVATSSAVDAEANVNYADLYSQQDGTLSNLANKFDYCTKSGAWDGDNLPSLTLENKLAILAITLKSKDGSSDLTSGITGMTLTDGTNNYTVTRSAAAGPIYVAIRPTSSAGIDIIATAGSNKYSKVVTSKSYTENNGYSISWRMTDITDAVLGKFTINSSGDRVYFSKGNLQAATSDLGANWTWTFATNQWDYIGNATANTSINGLGTVSTNGTVDLFGWSTNVTNYGIYNSTNIYDYSGDFVDWGATMGTGWYTLTSAEWTYLLDTRTVNGGTGNGYSYTYGQKVNNVLGVVIYPDGYNGVVYSGSDWSTFEAAGCVFLPAAGYYYWYEGTEVKKAGEFGSYWSCTPHSNQPTVYSLYFTSSSLNPQSRDGGDYRFSVRLVRPVE